MEHHCVHLVGWPGEESAENCTTSTEESVPSFLSEEEEATWIHRVFFLERCRFWDPQVFFLELFMFDCHLGCMLACKRCLNMFDKPVLVAPRVMTG